MNFSLPFSGPALALSLLTLLLTGCDGQESKEKSAGHSYTNELIHESSPYLLQHAHNPVNWHPWGEKALQKAEAENKLLLISIGYAACHWCHVMEHESFEDTAVARIMNDHFVNIKVDREERPDVDDIYMTACQLASREGCGWPLNAFALPNGKPVWAGTYFPKKAWLEVLAYFQEEWESNPDKMKEYATQLTEGISEADIVPVPAGKANFTPDKLHAIAGNLLNRIDFKNGGRKGAPKFPMPATFRFLLQYHHYSGDEEALQAVTLTLDRIARGGIYDHLGGGFARYSTDADWLVPHFEKMLYDNGQLVSLFSEAYQVTGDSLYRKVVEETLAYIDREMTSPEGAFYSSLDADSEGEEGKFYVWKKAEIDSLLGEDASAVFCDFYEVSSAGNWEEEKNILHRKTAPEQIADKHNLPPGALARMISDGKEKLLKARSQRVRPGLDDKALTAWNAIMLKGYVDAYRAFSNEDYLQSALENGNFILEKVMQENGRLNRNYKDGKSVINAFLDDYALTANAFISLYQATFDEKWLYNAKKLVEYALEHFSDDTTGLFFYTSDIDPPLVARKTESTDNVIPGSNSTMAHNLYLLGLYFYNTEWLETSKTMMHTLSLTIENTDAPDFYSNWNQLYLQLVRPPYEVAIVGDDAPGKQKELLSAYLPHAILLGSKDEGSLELLKNKQVAGKTLIYVCRNKICKLPVEQVEQALELMANNIN